MPIRSMRVPTWRRPTNALALQQTGQASGPEEGMGQVHLVHPAHEQQIGFRDRLGPVVQTRSAQPEELALAHDGERGGVPVDHRFALGRSKRPSAPAKKSRSMVSSPTLARRSRIWRSASSRTGFPWAKTSLRCSSACLRQAAIWVAWTPWRDTSSVSVASPRRASRATRALNFEEWFLRERFMVSTPLHWHYRRYDGAVHPLNAARFFVQKSAPTSDCISESCRFPGKIMCECLSEIRFLG